MKPLWYGVVGKIVPSGRSNLSAAVAVLGLVSIVLIAGSGYSRVAHAAERMGVSTDVNIKDTAWVWSQNPEHYTVQLLGGSDEEALEAVMRGLSLPGELVVVQTLRSGNPWYTLSYGRFANKAAAQDAVSRLPDGLKKTGPWLRSFSALQDEIGQAGTVR